MKNAIYEITGLSKIIVKDEMIQIRAQLKINWAHEMFKGHFPGNPVLPGVVQIQIVTDVVSKVFKKDLALSNASNIKFINMVIPENSSILTIGMDVKPTGSHKYNVTATLHAQQIIFLKLKGLFSPVELLSHRANP